MREELLIIFIVVLVVLIVLFITQAKPEKRKIILINSKNKTVEVNAEIANNMLTRMRGLMFRDSLPQDSGMLFVFDNEAYHSFWMANTTIPLEAIHFDSNGTVVDIIHMEPCKTVEGYCRTYTPKSASKYVLEVNEGFSESNSIKINTSFYKI